jgi:hypothetical protein
VPADEGEAGTVRTAGCIRPQPAAGLAIARHHLGGGLLAYEVAAEESRFGPENRFI